MSKQPIEHSNACETQRREAADPLVGLRPISDEIDYATAGLKMSTALTHLDESIAGRQRLRTQVAMAALLEGVSEMYIWLGAQGWYTAPQVQRAHDALLAARASAVPGAQGIRGANTPDGGVAVVDTAWPNFIGQNSSKHPK